MQVQIAQAGLSDTENMTRKRSMTLDDPRRIAPNIAPIPAEPTKDLVKKRWSRFDPPSKVTSGEPEVQTDEDQPPTASTSGL